MRALVGQHRGPRSREPASPAAAPGRHSSAQPRKRARLCSLSEPDAGATQQQTLRHTEAQQALDYEPAHLLALDAGKGAQHNSQLSASS